MQLAACYKLLDLDPDADAASAKRAYKAQVRRWHPDQFAEGSTAKAGAEEQLKQINVAYGRIKAHLSIRRSPDAVHTAPSPTRPAQTTTPRSDEASTAARRRSWFDHLVNALQAFRATRGEGSTQPSATQPRRKRSPRFDKILADLAGGPIAAPPRRHASTADITARRPAAGYRRRRRNGNSVGAVGGMDHPGPVKPVGRVRGIGRGR